MHIQSEEASLELTPAVSVVCVVYNHEPYIAQAIESFLCQETTFPYEIVVHDDASTDHTFDVISEFCKRYPDRIKYIRQPKNVYSQGERIFDVAISYSVGKFVALCEGDDFWTDPKKLQKQYEYLIEHPEVGAVFGDANIHYQKTDFTLIAHDSSRGFIPPTGDVRESLLKGNPYKTCTVMLRREAILGYAKHAKKLKAKMDDYVAWLYIAGRYRIGYIHSVLGTYRVLEHSASHFSEYRGKVRFEQSVYKVATYFNNLYGGVLGGEVLRSTYSFTLFVFFLRSSKPGIALRYVRCSHDFLRLLYTSVYRGLAQKYKRVQRLSRVS